MRIEIDEDLADLIRSRQNVVNALERELQFAQEKLVIANGALSDAVTTLARRGGLPRGVECENVQVAYENGKPILKLIEKLKQTDGAAG